MLPLQFPRIPPALAVVAACIAMAGAPAAQQPAASSAQPSTPTLSSKIGAQVTELKKIDVKQGDGAEAVAGKTVIVHYTGWLYDPAAADGHGTKFDSSMDRKVPFDFMLGAGRVIKGWDQGVLGMKIGESRRLIIPADMAYGDSGAGGVIPPGATLVFDIELVAIE